MSVIVVGNGPIKNMGSKIDAFDTVIRCHAYILNYLGSLQQDVGKKVDIIAEIEKKYTAEYILGKYKGNWEIWHFDNKKGNMDGIAYNIAKNAIGKRIKAGEILPRTGMVAIFEAMRHMELPVYFTGFTFENARFNILDPVKKPRWGMHDPLAEKPVFDKLMYEGKIVKLDEKA